MPFLFTSLHSNIDDDIATLLLVQQNTLKTTQSRTAIFYMGKFHAYAFSYSSKTLKMIGNQACTEANGRFLQKSAKFYPLNFIHKYMVVDLIIGLRVYEDG